MTAFLMSFALIFAAEMGDKSMLLALAFATRYSWHTVLGGVFFATLLNHLAVVWLGTYLTHGLPMEAISLVCSLSFICFGLWTLKGEEAQEEKTASNRSPFLTVAVAFFLSEMGDKTQLATLALAAEYQNMQAVWLGTTLGMTLADAAGILIGRAMGKKIPETLIQAVSASIFIVLGLAGFYEALPEHTDKWLPAVFFTSTVFLAGYLIGKPLLTKVMSTFAKEEVV